MFADRWDPEKNRWREGKKVPTIADGVRLFNDEVRSVTDDRKTNLVIVAVEWYSPELAARWTNQLIDMTNERLRSIAMGNAERSIQYLNDELAKTNVVELRQAIFGLIESQINNAMLANVQHEYAFHFIDRAVVPDRKVAPKRSLISLVGAFAGFSLGLLIVFFRRAPASAPRRP